MSEDAGAPGRLASWRVVAPPVLLSLLLSASTVGSHPQWQDSAIYLTAVREFGVLYPPGFVLYLVLCKGWTLLAEPVFGFTLAVHLFSSLCAAAAAGATASAALAASRHAASSTAVGCLAAAGYTWWFSGIYAKGYALYVLLVALLLQRLLRKDHRGAALLLALAWAAHPSAALLGPAVLYHAWAYRAELLARGRRWIATTLGLAALCGLGPSLLLPVLSARETAFAMGHVASLGRLGDYVTGKKFVEMPGAWGVEPARVLTVLRYAWEEFLGIGLALVVGGLVLLRRQAPGRLLGLAIWCGTVIVVTTLFKIEGQHDLWLLAAWIPLYAAAAVGLAALAARWKHAPLAAAAAGLLWAVAANYRDVDQRRYDLVERFGEAHLKDLAPGAILILGSDDSLGICTYMQAVRGLRPDVLLVSAGMIWSPEGTGWYLERLRKRRPGLNPPDERPPDPAAVASFANVQQAILAQAALANANVGPDSPVYFEKPPPPAAVRQDHVLVRAGLLWKMAPRGAPEPGPWAPPVSAEEVAAGIRRARGQRVQRIGDELRVGPEPYEWRFLKPLLDLRVVEAERQLRLKTPEGYRAAAGLLDSVLKMDRDEIFDGRCALLFGSALAAIGDRSRAALAFEAALEKGGLQPAQEAAAWLQRGELYRAEGKAKPARDCFERAARLPGLEPALKAEIERRLTGP